MTSQNFKPALRNEELVRPGAYINGEWITTAKESFKVTDPATEQVIAELPDFDSGEAEAAIKAAHSSFQSYKKTSPTQRSEWLRNLYDLIMENAEDLAAIVTWENGKSLREALVEIRYGASFFKWFSEEALRLYGTTIQPSNPGNRAFTLRQPVGVCALICPWNFPNAMISRKAAPALAAGCTVIIKPDPQTPLSSLAIAYLAEKAGFPPGVVNVVLTSKYTKDIGLQLCESSLVRKVSFTGSTAVGKILMRQAAATVKKVSFELGGNAPVIIMQDADIEKTVKEVLATKFRGMGQTCICANRLYVQRSIIDDFAARLAKAVEGIKLGNGFKDGVTHGSLINTAAIEKVERHAKDAIERGAKVLLPGGRVPELGPHFYSPTVLSHVDPQSVVAREETFGPLCAMIPFDTVEEVVGYANDTQYGLASYVFSENISTVYSIAEALDFGMVACNTGLFSDSMVPFGGIKESGFGIEGSLHGINDYTVLKTVTIGNIPTL
ncbi:AaceriAER007Wp [[Ashbya] aceris (nom. inval.)]|nr:AaceriAER007Wp [[Ashbya] aceris (nom. inval.)]